jgi:predicted ATPase/class 3 adenylate cyclase
MSVLPTGTVTFLFTDIEGSTTLLQRLGDRRYAEVLAEHQRLLRATFAEGNGQEVDTQGDAFLVAFSRARDAVATAVVAQQSLMKHTWPDGASLRVRMGLHTGEPLSESGSYVGLDVHRAARIGTAGHGGQILLSQAVGVLAVPDLPPGVSLRDLGSHRLKDLREPEHLFQVVHPDLATDFPPLKSLDVLLNNLPRQLTSFVGRGQEMAEVKRLLGAARLVTLTGSGGAGKTRLALQAAADVVEGYPDGVWLAECAPIADPVLVPKTVASALNVPEQPGREMIETLVAALRPKALLLVLDNCEHLLAACANLAAALLRACPGVRILATSREGLDVPGEILWRVPSLSVPEDIRHLPPSGELVLYDAVRLFVDRAAATAPGFTVTTENAPAVVQVCQHLDGIPLAIELAAARVKVLAVEQIAVRLDDRFRFLIGGGRIVLPRHQTLRAAIDWSYHLLSETERVLLRRLSVFARGWTLEAVESVCAGESVETTAILDLLTSLVDKSLVLAETQRGDARYRLLETVRQYARDRLREAGEEAEVRTRHRAWCLTLAEQADAELRGPRQRIWLDRLEVEHDNLRSALAWSAECGDTQSPLRLSCALWWFWYVRGHHREGRKWLENALEGSEDAPPALRAKVHNGAGYLAADQGDYAAALAHFEEGLAMHRTLGDKAGAAESLHGLGRVAWRQGDFERAVRFYEEALTFREELAVSFVIAWVLNSLVTLTMAKGDLSKAAALVKESLAINRQIGNRRGVAVATGNLGTVALRLGNYSEAGPLLREALALRWEIGDKRGIVSELVELGLLLAAQRDPVHAARLLAAAEALGESIGAPLSPSERAVADYDRYIAILAADLSPEVFKAEWAEGRSMTLEQTLDYAMKETG